jgi:hypothetical protein
MMAAKVLPPPSAEAIERFKQGALQKRLDRQRAEIAGALFRSGLVTSEEAWAAAEAVMARRRAR